MKPSPRATPTVPTLAAIPSLARSPRPHVLVKGSSTSAPLVYWRWLLGSIFVTTSLVGLVVAAAAWRNSRRVELLAASKVTAVNPAPALNRQRSPSQEVESAIADSIKEKLVPQVRAAESSAPAPDDELLDDLCVDADFTPPPPATPIPQAELVTSAPPAPPPLMIKRRSWLSDEDLRKQLLQVAVVDRNIITPAARRFILAARKDRKYSPDELPDFAGLPMRMGVDCQIGKEGAENLQALSRKLRTILAEATNNGTDPRPNAAKLRVKLLGAGAEEWRQPEAVPALCQLLMAENKPVRLLLVEVLSRIKDAKATAALAQRALFDLSFDVREAAVRALDSRPRAEYRARFLDGFRYPWPAVADHAAEALVALRDREAVPGLRELLEDRDPAAPFQDADQRLRVRELVRINHLSNCLMCHSQSISTLDLVRGQVPSPSQPLPPPVQYYDSGHGLFARADVTYLQQDFSVPQPVSKPGLWPTNQRFDYLIRTRPAGVVELRAYLTRLAQRPSAACEQHEAARFAIRELLRAEVEKPAGGAIVRGP